MSNLFYDNLEYSLSDSLYFLRLFSKYNHDNNTKINIGFKYGNKDAKGLTLLRQELGLGNIMGTGSELQRLLRILKWAAEYLGFKGKPLDSRRYDKDGWFDTIETAKKEGYCLNCRYISLLFTQILLAVGFKARWVTCLPMELNYKECHCVTEVFVESLNKWIVVDAAYNLLYFDKKGIY